MILENGNTANSVVQGGTTAFLSNYFNSAYMDMLPWLMAAAPLLIGDLYFGWKKVRYKHIADNGDKPSVTKAIGMTLDKAFSYVCWILISTTLSIAFGSDILKYTIMAIVYIKELISCFRNYYNAKGYDVNEADLFRLLWKMAVRKGEQVGEDINDTITKKKEERE